MKSEIKILLEDGSSNKAQGTCFENLIRNILSAHQYEVTSNVNFAGMEIDLLAKHKIRNETLYVECKAKEKVSSTEIRNFWFNMSDKEADYGYFIRTKEVESQAAGLIEEMKKKVKYKNLTFIEPDGVIKILTDSNFIQEPRLPSDIITTKRVLCVTYKGDYLLYIATRSSVIPTNFLLFHSKNCKQVKEQEIIAFIKEKLDEIKELDHLILDNSNESASGKDSNEQNHEEYESISEVQSSEDWFDYLPASSKHFVGRASTRAHVFDFFKNAATNQTARRVFYLTGKSGWGKSSLIAEICGRCQNIHYKNKYFAYAVDTRSAISQNFVALAFKGMLKKAIENGFIESASFTGSLSFTSNQELLSSDSIKSILDQLKKKNRTLILIFDQFEDVFRKQGLFKSFYKFLNDVTDSKHNLIIGFSWKTEILIPSENEAYHYWQQAKEQAVSFTIPEFGEKEIDGVINQLVLQKH